MEEKVIWKLVYWEMKMVKNGWWSKPVFRVYLKYGTLRNQRDTETKQAHEDFKTLKAAFDYLEKAIALAEKVKL